jgi:hypothetical protein
MKNTVNKLGLEQNKTKKTVKIDERLHTHQLSKSSFPVEGFVYTFQW